MLNASPAQAMGDGLGREPGSMPKTGGAPARPGKRPDQRDSRCVGALGKGRRIFARKLRCATHRAGDHSGRPAGFRLVKALSHGQNGVF